MKKLLAFIISGLFAAVAFAQPAAADKAFATGQPGLNPSEGANTQNQKMQAVNDPDAQPALTQQQVQKIKEKRAVKKANKAKKKSMKKAKPANRSNTNATKPAAGDASGTARQ
jgi:hypothetical protein